ncbi:hypothetical protein DFP73DRAFT_528913 [Morchella snyderi]|nr:hypothetical protein DFP73DRAFT_528913 [Morchella snyderi]
MASLSSPPPHLSHCTPYCTSDPVLGHVLVFYNPFSLTSSAATSKIEAHILTCAGLQSYPKLILSPSSPLYAAVNHLPLPKQSVEVYRGLAIAVLKYFSELPKAIKEKILRSKSNLPQNGEGQAVAFDEMHAGDLAARLKEVEMDGLVGDIMPALSERFVSWLDVDLVIRSPNGEEVTEEAMSDGVEELLSHFGDPTHLPFTKLKRAASRPASARPQLKINTAALERELEELRYTEANYVAKLRDLIENLVIPLRARFTQKKAESGFPSARDLDTLFPPCLDKILEVNTRFLAEIELGGIEEVAKVCLKHFPEFKDCYAEYLRASPEFAQLLGRFSKDKHSSFSKRVQQTGEQKLRSLIIEPVQRLPRYALLIDNMLNSIPLDHPSLIILMEAREIITEICSLQSSDIDERSQTTKRLQSIIVSWPSTLKPSGRLITGIDFLDVLPPFNDQNADAIPSTMLLFADRLVILRRPKPNSMQARAIMAEVDRPGGAMAAIGSGTKREGSGCDLQFAGWMDLSDVRIAESDGGDIVWMTLAKDLNDSWDVRAGGMGLRRMRLLNAYEGRATKFAEDLVKAKLERRVSTNGKGVIGLREIKSEGLGFWSCVWGSETRYTAEKRKGGVVVYIDDGGGGGGSGKWGKELTERIGKQGVDIAVSVEAIAGNKVRVEFRSWNDYSSTDTVPPEELLAVFTKRVSSLLRLHSLPQHPPLTSALMSANRKLLRASGVPFDGESRFSRLRPPSPVKLFSSFLGSNNNNSNNATGIVPGSPNKRPVLLDRTQSQMLPPKVERTPSTLQKRQTVMGVENWSLEDINDYEEKSDVSITMANESPLKRLEETFEAFIVTLRMFSSADADLDPLREMHGVDNIAVEEFLEDMVHNPKSVKIEMDLGVDVVFEAFRRFLRGEWKDGMGPVIAEKALAELQSKSEELYPGDFEDFFKIFVLDWTPQNKRAFRTIVILLRAMQGRVQDADDKGLLTKAFTELLVFEDSDPFDFMPLVDRLVEEADSLFNGNHDSFCYLGGPTDGSTASDTMNSNHGEAVNGNGAFVKRHKSVTSVAYSTTSLRKRLGLSHNSMRDPYSADGKSSVWRTLSKSSKLGQDTHKGHLARSKSTDYDARPYVQPAGRPSSRDSPNLLNAFSNPMSSALPPLRPLSSVIPPPHPSPEKPLPVEPPNLGVPSTPSGAPRRKRRSSLSDLTNHPDYQPILPPMSSTPDHPDPLHLPDHEPLRFPDPEPLRFPDPEPLRFSRNTPDHPDPLRFHRYNTPDHPDPLRLSRHTGTPDHPDPLRLSRHTSTPDHPDPLRVNRQTPDHPDPLRINRHTPDHPDPLRPNRHTPDHPDPLRVNRHTPDHPDPLRINRHTPDHPDPLRLTPRTPDHPDPLRLTRSNGLRNRSRTTVSPPQRSNTPPHTPSTPGRSNSRLSDRSNEISARRGTTGNTGATSSPGPQRLKMQSTQKLRERLLSEKQAITRVESGLQREIDKIGEELSMASRLSGRGTAHSAAIKELTSRISQLESRIPEINDLTNKLETVTNKLEIERSKFEITLEKKNKELEGLVEVWNDCLNENDVMFETFNKELVKMSAALKQGRGEAEILKLLQEVRVEQGKLKRENMRLRKENSGLKALVEVTEVKERSLGSPMHGK